MGGDAGALYREAQKAEKAGQMAKAYLLYSQAAALEPMNPTYWIRSQAVRTRALLETNSSPRLDAEYPAPAPAVKVDLDDVTAKDLADARKPQPPRKLNGDTGRKDLDLKLAPRPLFELVAKTYSLDCVFDGDFPASGPTIRFRMDQVDYREALHAVEAATGSFIVPLSDRIFLVAKDSIQKRLELEPSVTVAVSIPQPVTIQQAQELAMAVRQAMEIRKFGIDTARRVIVMRDSISKIYPARQLVMELLAWEPEVAIDLELMEVSQTDALSLGLDITTQFPVVSFAHVLNSAPSIPQAVTRLATFGGGRTLFGIGLGGRHADRADEPIARADSDADDNTVRRRAAGHVPRGRPLPGHVERVFRVCECRERRIHAAASFQFRGSGSETESNPPGARHRRSVARGGVRIQGAGRAGAERHSGDFGAQTGLADPAAQQRVGTGCRDDDG